MRAIVMAGGQGSRLKPFTMAVPKPLLRIDGEVLLDRILVLLLFHKFEVVVVVNYMGDAIRDHVKFVSSLVGRDISVLSEGDTPLGTAGILPSILEDNEDALVMNADLITNIDLTEMQACYRSSQKPLMMAVREVHHAVPYGVVNIANGAYNSMTEKPVSTYMANAGIYILNRKVLPATSMIWNMTDTINMLDVKDVGLYPIPPDVEWRDIGRHGDITRGR